MNVNGENGIIKVIRPNSPGERREPKTLYSGRMAAIENHLRTAAERTEGTD